MFIDQLHWWKPSVTPIMVKRWNEGIVKINGADFTMMEEVIYMVTTIPIIGKKLYKDGKISRYVAIEFVKDVEEMKALAKKGTYDLPSSIKPLWRFLLRIIIMYISMDTKFDRLCTYHFY